MGSPESPVSCVPSHDIAAWEGGEEAKSKSPSSVMAAELEARSSLVDPFLVEALGNPRHRLIVLRMELDIQRFMQNPDLREFEFQLFPTSYLRCAAHRVAHHYGLETMTIDNTVDPSASRIVARKTSESKYPAIFLTEIHGKQTESETAEKFKIVVRERPRASQGVGVDVETKKSHMKTVEERKEEYDKARARIFCDSNVPDREDSSLTVTVDGREVCLGSCELVSLQSADDEHKRITTTDGPSRIAIFKDKEKDRNDPDYDRSYGRYVRGLAPGVNFSFGTFNPVPPPFVQYEAGLLQSGNFPRNQTCGSYGPSDLSMGRLPAVGYQQTPGNAVFMQWPAPTLMYAQCYHNLSHTSAPVPVYQSLDGLQNG